MRPRKRDKDRERMRKRERERERMRQRKSERNNKNQTPKIPFAHGMGLIACFVQDHGNGGEIERHVHVQSRVNHHVRQPTVVRVSKTKVM